MLLKTWFSSIVVVLLGALSFALYYFDLTNVLDWAILVVLIVSLILTALVYLEQPHKKEFKTLQKTYSDFLKKKDSQIEDLTKKNDVIFRTAVKRTEKELEEK